MDPLAFLTALRSRLIRVLVIEGLARVVAIVVTAAVLSVAADWLWRLPGLVRFGLLAGVVAAAGLVMWVRLGRPFRRDLSDAALARFAERRVPELDGRLLTHIEGIAMGDRDQQMLRAVLAGIDPRTLIPARRTPKQVGIGLTALVAVMVASVAIPETAADGAQRLLLPLGAGEWRKHTGLNATLEHDVVPVDGTLVLAITRHHPQADFSAPVVVTWKGGAVDESRQLGGLTGTTWSTSIAAPVGVYELTISSADAEPVVLSARVVARPSVGRMRATQTPPAYTGLPAQTVDTLAGSLIPGTKIEFIVGFVSEPGRDITTATARFHDLAVALTAVTDASAKGAQFSGAFTVLTAGSLDLAAADQDGIALAGDARFPLTITPDRPPVVSLSGPAAREAVTVRAVIELALAASDDFGLGDLTLSATTVHGEASLGDEKAAPKPTPPTAPATAEVLEKFTGVAGQLSVNRTATVEIGRHAAEGEQLLFSGRAHDRNDVSGPGVGDSEVLALRVVPEDLLHQELDRLLGEAKERVAQARDDLASAHEVAAQARHLRSASQATAKADELLVQVLRRWAQNRLAPEGILPGAKARTIISDTALPKLAEASAGAEVPRQAADTALAEAERLLGSILQEGDLTRLLTSLIARETAIAVETRGFVKAFLTKSLDPAGKALQQNLAMRQRELAELSLDLERRLLTKDGSTWTKAQDLVRKEAPGDRLRQASTDLSTNDRRNKAVDGQQEALVTLNKLLDALRGGDAAHDLAGKLGQLAVEQEQVAKELERGATPGTQAAKQKDLAERTAAASREAASKDAATAKTLAGAQATQESAERGMQRGDASAAARDANAAAGLLREAQRQLAGEQKQDEDADKKDKKDKSNDKKKDVLALLKELRTLQAALVTDATLLDQKAAEKQLDFAAQRQVLTLANSQSDLLLRVREDALRELDKSPIARVAVERVATAMDNAQHHLATPALGAKGLRLTRIALAELGRLIDVAEAQPEQDAKKKPAGSGGDGGGGGQAPQAAFPPSAEIALLAAMQEDLNGRTAAGHPGDLAAAQELLQQLVESMAQTARPDTRPAILLERTRRAMTSAAYQLKQADRGVLTRNEQQVAEASLRRLLAESGGDGSGGGGGGNKPPPPSGSGQKPPPASGDGQGKPEPATAGAGQAGKSTGDGKSAALPVQATTTAGELLELPPAMREQLRQAREQHFTPGQLQIYQRYLELLEDGK